MTFAAGGAFDPDGPVAAEIATLWWVMLALGTFAFLVFGAALAAGLIRAGRKDPERRPASARALRWWVVGGGVILPTILLVLTLGLTIETMRDTPNTAPPGALQIEIVGHQFFYEVHYPAHGVTARDEVHIPVGRPIEFRLTSADVIHSFWVPRLGGKMDMLPDKTTTLVLQADEPGTHRAHCAEFCGLHHAHMELRVVAESEEDFDAWIAANAGNPAP